MRYSSRKLRNHKVITTACNFWRQIACSFQVMSGKILFLGNKMFEIPPFFQTRPGDLDKKVHACSIRFSALKWRVALRWSLATLQPAHSLVSRPRDQETTGFNWTSFNFNRRKFSEHVHVIKITATCCKFWASYYLRLFLCHTTNAKPVSALLHTYILYCYLPKGAFQEQWLYYIIYNN